MKNAAYFCFLIFTIFNLGKINSKLSEEKFYHPLRLKYDFSNLQNNKDNEPLISLLTESSEILTKLIYTDNIKNISIDSTTMAKCKTELSFKNSLNPDADIVIFPILDSVKNKYKIEFCSNYKNKMPSIVILKINKNLNFSSENENERYALILHSLKMLTDCLGLDRSYLKKKKFYRNNFFETPYYLTDKMDKSFKSIKKLYDLSGKKIPDKNISINGNFYLSFWNKDFIVKDFRSDDIDIEGDISESSLNFFNDINFYSMSKFDFEFIGHIKKCYRVDQKCLNETQLKNYYLNYGINQNNNNEIICYLSNSDNIKNNQCGIQYSQLIGEKSDFCPLISKKKIIKKEIKNNNIPDFFYYDNQTLNLLKPSPKCRSPSPRTIYFKSFEREENLSDIYSIDTINLNKKQKKFFVTYLVEDEVYLNMFVNILHKNGIIRSYYHNNNQNFYIKGFDPKFFLKNNKNSDYFNDYQKLYHFMGVEEFFFKDLLYQNYKYMKSYFPKAYSYMPKTYEYPKDEKAMKEKFSEYKVNLKDLWIVKPTQLFGGRGVHIFKSLEEENKNYKHYIISKYLGNPHLINEKKYDMRIYVLITGFQPLRVYLYNEGLIRIAVEKYNLKKDTLDNKFAHLTNTAINIKSKKYLNPKSDIDEKANKWNFKTYRNYLQKQNVDIDLIFDKIKDIIIKCLISGQKKIVNKTEQLKLDDINMFNLFGFDVFIDNKYDAHLLEVNTRPFMHEYNKYDKIIKSNLFVDTLNIVGISPFSHDKEHKLFDKGYSYEDKVEKRVDDAFCELTRPRGDYELIFPLKDNIDKYKNFFFKNKGKENILFWKKIQNSENE